MSAVEATSFDSDRPDRSRSRLTPLRELQLLEAHRSGDPSAIGSLLEGYQRRIYAICYRMVRHEQEASDLTQDAMVKVLEGLDSYHGRSKLSTWIIRVTLNCCLSYLRRQKLRRHGSLSEAGQGDSPGDTGGILVDRREPGPRDRVEQNETRERLLTALSSLDPETRAILVLRDLQDLDYQQVAEVLDVPIGTVKSRLFRARAALREAVERGQPPTDD